jgi:hypothetical protein
VLVVMLEKRTGLGENVQAGSLAEAPRVLSSRDAFAQAVVDLLLARAWERTRYCHGSPL